jgi:hypothetical protein
MKLRPLILVACVAALSACAGQTVLVDNPPSESNPAVRTFDQHGISFQYPGTWLTFQVDATNGGASPSAPAPVQPQQQSLDIVGLDELNRVSVAYGLSGMAADDFAAWSAQAKATLAGNVAAHKARLLEPPQEIQTAGLPALRYAVRVPSGLGYNLDVTWVGFLRGTTEFVVTCSSIPTRTQEIQPGCEQILSTLAVR